MSIASVPRKRQGLLPGRRIVIPGGAADFFWRGVFFEAIFDALYESRYLLLARSPQQLAVERAPVFWGFLGASGRVPCLTTPCLYSPLLGESRGECSALGGGPAHSRPHFMPRGALASPEWGPHAGRSLPPPGALAHFLSWSGVAFRLGWYSPQLVPWLARAARPVRSCSPAPRRTRTKYERHGLAYGCKISGRIALRLRYG
jgi:hypothetical protein